MASPSASLKKYAQDRVVINCDVCDAGKENEAEHYCGDCNQYLCVSCEKFHKKFHKDHKLVTPFQGRAIGRLDLTVICSKHNKTYSLYCRHCNANICDQCPSEHAGHKLENIHKHAKVLKTDLTEHVHKVEKCLSDLNSKSDMLKAHLLNFDKLTEKQISLVENETAKIRTALETQSAKLIQDFKKEKQMARVTLSDQIRTVDDCKRDIEGLTTSIKAQIDIAPDTGMLQLFNDAKTKLETKSSKKTLTLPNPSTFTPASLGDQLLVGSTHSTGSTDHTLDILCGAFDTHAISKTPTTQSHTPLDPSPSLRRELSVLHELSLGLVDSCTTDGSSCWVGVYTGFTSGKVQLVNKHGEQLLTVELPHGVDYTALTSTGDLLVSGDNTTKITRVTRQGKTRAFVNIKARDVEGVRGLCTTQQDDVFVCVTMADDKTNDRVIKMSAKGKQILQVSQHLFTSNKLYGIHKISRDTFCVQDGEGRDQGSRLIIIDAGGQLLRHINRTGELQAVTWDITGDRHGHIIAGTDTYDGDIHVCSGEGACIHTYKLPGSGGIWSLSVGEDDVMWVGTEYRGLIVAKYLE